MHVTEKQYGGLRGRQELQRLGLTQQTVGGFVLLFSPAGGSFVARGTTLDEALIRARNLRSRNLARWERPGRGKKDAGPTLFDELEGPPA